MKLWKYSGILLLATGIIHTIFAIPFGWNAFGKMINDGLINTVGEDMERNLAFWFLACGIFIIFLGQILHYYIKKSQQPAPRSFGWGLLIFTIIGCVIVPLSGIWLFLPQALIIIFAKRK